MRIALARGESRLRRQREVVNVTVVHARGRAVDHPVPLNGTQRQELRVDEVATLCPRNARSIEGIQLSEHRVPDDFAVLEEQAGLRTIADGSVELGILGLVLEVHRTVDGRLRVLAVRVDERLTREQQVRAMPAVTNAVTELHF